VTNKFLIFFILLRFHLYLRKTLVVVVPTSAVKEFEENYTSLGDPEQDQELEKREKESDSLVVIEVVSIMSMVPVYPVHL
jgi:hypothetical protein